MSRVLGDAFVVISPETAGFAGQADIQIRRALATLKPTITVGADIRGVTAAIADLKTRMAALSTSLLNLRVNADTKQAEAAIARLQAQLATLTSRVNNMKIGADTSGLIRAEAQVTALEASIARLTDRGPPATAALGTLAATAIRAGGAWGFLNTPIALFGGLLNRVLPQIATTVTVGHVLADAIVEIGAVLIPASLAFGAFGIAGSDAAKEIANRMQVVHTVMDATGQSIYPMTNAMEQLHDAVRPQVYQLFGDAITIMNAKTGLFQTVAKGTATVVDQLAARFTYAVTQGGGLSQFMSHAVQDASQLGTVIGNVGGIFGNLAKAVPGYAQVLLSFAVSFTAILENVTRVAEPFIHFTLLLHGFVLYTGLAVTASLAFIGAMGSLARQFIAFAAGQVISGITALKTFGLAIAGMVTRLYAYGAALISIAAEEGVFAAATLAIQDIPIVVWITAAAVAIGGLIALFRSGPSVTQQFTDGLQKTVAAAQLTSVVSTIMSAQADVTQRLTAARAELARTTEYGTAYEGRSGVAIRVVTEAYSQQQGVVDDLTNAQKQLSDQYNLVTGRIGALAKQYGGTTGALGALNAAGITTSQILDTNNQHWAQALIQVNSTTDAYKAMGTQAGALGNDLDVLGRTVTDQYAAVQKLNQGWASFIQEVAGSQGTFDTYAQGLSTLSDHSGSLVQHLGLLKVSYKDQQAAIDSLTPSGLALNQAFSDQIQTTSKLYESWRTAGVANDLFTQGVKDSIEPLLKYANGSQEATAQLVALAEQAGYQGPVSMQALVKWLGNTRDATQHVKDITNQATTQEALLTGAMQAQGSYIANTLIGDINNAILKYNGVAQAATDYGTAVAKSGAQSDAAQAARQRLITDLINSGVAAHDTTGQIAAMITKVLGIPPKEAIQIVMQGDGSYSIQQQEAVAKIFQARGQGNGPQGVIGSATGGGLPGGAAGMMIPAGGARDRDSVLVAAKPGELLVPTHLVNAVRPVLGGKIPGFAGGGVIPGFQGGGVVPNFAQTGNTDVLSGQYAVDMVGQFRASMTQAMLLAMKNAVSQAAQMAVAASTSGIGGGVKQWSSTVLQALALLGLPAADLGIVLSQMTTESGGNPTIVNTTDSNWLAGHPSVGLMQVIAGTFDAYAGPFRNIGPFEYGVSTNPLANIFAGLNYAVHAYGNPGWTGVLGRGHGYAYGGKINERVLGVGLQSGLPYSFGERGRETVTPEVPGTGGLTPGELAIIERLERLIAVGIQAPSAYAQSLSGVAGQAASRGYYGAG